jgi:hypothetical protein
MVLEQGRETVFHHDGNLQIGPGLLKQAQGGSREDTITE